MAMAGSLKSPLAFKTNTSARKQDIRCRLDDECQSVLKQFTALVAQNTTWLDEYIDAAVDQNKKG